MRRGEVRLVDLDPVRGSEANKRRPAVVVSNDRANAAAERLGRGVVTVVPLTSNTARVFPFQVLIPAEAGGLRIASKAQAEQVRFGRVRATWAGPWSTAGIAHDRDRRCPAPSSRPVAGLDRQVVTCLLWSRGRRVRAAVPGPGRRDPSGDPRRARRTRRPVAVRALLAPDHAPRDHLVPPGHLAAPCGPRGGRPGHLAQGRSHQAPPPGHHAAAGPSPQRWPLT